MEGTRSFSMEFENLKATELTLGLPGAEIKPTNTISYLKRSIDDSEANQPLSKLQIVGWPPIRSYKVNKKEADATLVKVNMDGAPYLRKIDIAMYKGYKELIKALETMFKCFLSKEGCKELSLNEVAYEDKEGDLMLVGDVPWDMFLSSCRKLRIMKK